MDASFSEKVGVSPQGRVCSIEGCGKPHMARGWCSRHYHLWRNRGDPLAPPLQFTSPEEAFEDSIMPLVETGCIVWLKALTEGCGNLWVDGRMEKAHRYAYERANGPIPPGLMIDHACRERSCVNTAHLRLATRSQNGQNRSGPTSRNQSGHRGVTWDETQNKWRVIVGKKYIGRFERLEDAAEAAQEAREKMFGEFAGKG